jgi:DNA-directed RNA polymerase specialized sigma24 family protein
MGRPRMTPEMRIARIDKRTRERLLLQHGELRAARAQVEKLEEKLRASMVKAGEKGASIRDLAALLGIPHQSAHQLVHPYERKDAAPAD